MTSSCSRAHGGGRLSACVAALADLREGLARSTHAVQQLLALARNEPGASQPQATAVRLGQLLQQVAADQLPLAEARSIDLGQSVMMLLPAE